MMRAHRISVAAGRLFASALYLCPHDLRRAYGADMRITFEARCRDAAARGPAAVIILIARELADLAIASVRFRRRVRTVSAFDRERSPLVTGLAQDIQYGIRMLRRQPSFTAVAVVTLALGIGATTAVFTVVNGVLLRPLPYGHPQDIVSLTGGRPGSMHPWFSPPNYLDLTSQSGVFSGAAAYVPTYANLT